MSTCNVCSRMCRGCNVVRVGRRVVVAYLGAMKWSNAAGNKDAAQIVTSACLHMRWARRNGNFMSPYRDRICGLEVPIMFPKF